MSKLYELDDERLKGIERLLVFGDIHGDSRFLDFFTKNFGERDLVLFLGDYADRGPNGIKVIELVSSLTNQYPQRVIPLKGNHENFSSGGIPKFRPCSLIQEVGSSGQKWQDYFTKKFQPFVESMYLGAIIPGEILFLHGGVSSKIISQESLVNPTSSIEEDILWSDPMQENGECKNFVRGPGVRFGPDITKKVCNVLNVKRIIRSHEPHKVSEGPLLEHDGQIITTSSTSAYGGKPFVLEFHPKIFDKYNVIYF